MTSSEPEKVAHEVIDDDDDGDIEQVPPPLEFKKGKGKASSLKEQEDSPASEESASDDASDSESSVQEANNEVATTSGGSDSSEPQPWQAVFAPQYNAYYFYNTQSGETTWTNPLQPSTADSASSSSSAATAATATPNASTSSTGQGIPPDHDTSEPHSLSSSTSTPVPYNALQAAALAQGIDPSLAHLDPTLLTATTSASGGPIPTFQAKFNARTGAFTKADARTPGHLSEYERMKRMSQFYFDVGAWEQQIADDRQQQLLEEEEEEGNGRKRKRPTKKDLERFKEQKKQKKIAKTAWLRT